MKLTGPQLDTLFEAMLDAFDRASLEREVHFRLDKKLDEIVPAIGNLRDIAYKLLDLANREGWIGKLMDAMQASVPGNQQLQTAIGQIQAEQEALAIDQQAIATDLDDPHGAYLIGRRVLMNRDELRDHMRHFTSADIFGPRLVVVTGPDASGKSYTREFVTYLSTLFQLSHPISVELSDWPAANCSPDELMDTIGRQCDFNTEDFPPDDEAQGVRRAIKLKDWFVGKTRNLAGEQWVVIDDLDHPGVPSETLDLVDLLSTAVIRNKIPRVRMVLLGYERPFSHQAKQDILFEQLAPIDARDVRLHTREIAAQYLEDAQLVDQEGTVIANAAMQGLAPPFDRDQLTTLSTQLVDAVQNFLERI